MSDLGFISYGKTSKQGLGTISMYTYPTDEEKQQLNRKVDENNALSNWLKLQGHMPTAVKFLPDVTRVDYLTLNPSRGGIRYMLGDTTWRVVPTRRAFWAWTAGRKDERAKRLLNVLLNEESMLQQYFVCSGNMAGLFHRLTKIKSSQDIMGLITDQLEFRSFLEQVWPWKFTNHTYFLGLDSFDSLQSSVKVSSSSSAGPGYIKIVERGTTRMSVNLKKGDPEAIEMCRNVVDWILTELKSTEKPADWRTIFGNHPGWFLAQLKPKQDYYTFEETFRRDIRGQPVNTPLKTRPYFAYQYHLSLLFSAFTQCVNDAQKNYQEDPTSWSMIGQSFMHGGTDKLWDFICGKGAYEGDKIRALFMSDDAVYRFKIDFKDGPVYYVSCPDVSGMDFCLTLRLTKFFTDEVVRRFKASSREENLDISELVIPREWESIADMLGYLAVVCPFVFQGKQRVALAKGLRSGVAGTSLFDQTMSFAIYWILRKWLQTMVETVEKTSVKLSSKNPEHIAQVCEVLSEKFLNIVKRLKDKYGIVFKKETTRMFVSGQVEKIPPFFNMPVTPYTILGHRIGLIQGKEGSHAVPVKSVDDLWRSLVKPRKFYKNGMVADMAELERVRGIAIGGGWLYDHTYSILKTYFEERRKSGKLIIPSVSGPPREYPLVPLSAVPIKMLSELKELNWNGVDELAENIFAEQLEYEEQLGKEYSNEILGDPDWFPDVEFISRLYSVPRAAVVTQTGELAAAAASIKEKIKEIDELGSLEDLIKSGFSWGDEEVERDLQATEAVVEVLEEKGIQVPPTRVVEVGGVWKVKAEGKPPVKGVEPKLVEKQPSKTKQPVRRDKEALLRAENERLKKQLKQLEFQGRVEASTRSVRSSSVSSDASSGATETGEFPDFL